MKKVLKVLMMVMVVAVFFTACSPQEDNIINSGDQVIQNKEYLEIEFSDIYEEIGGEYKISSNIQDLNEKNVKLKGFFSLQVSNEITSLYLTTQPRTLAPYMGSERNDLAMIPVYMADESELEYTNDEVIIYGTLRVYDEAENIEKVRIYTDNIEILEPVDISETSGDVQGVQDIQEYYLDILETSAVFNIQNMQLSIDSVSDSAYMVNYGDTKQEIVNEISRMYVGADEALKGEAGYGKTYVELLTENLENVKKMEVEGEELENLHKDIVALYEEQIDLLKKYEKIAYENYQKELTDAEAEQAYNELTALREENLELYNRFMEWNKQLGTIE